MGNTYYVDPTAVGDDDGTSEANAWTTLQRAVDGTDGTQPVAGDTIYCRGTENISAAVDFDGNSGDATNGFIRFIGVNSSWVNDGTYYVLDGGNQNINGIMANNMHRVWLENIKITQCDATAAMGHTGGYHDSWVLNNVWCHDNAAYGLDCGYYRYIECYRCRFTNNTSGGVYRPAYQTPVYFAFCEFTGNTGDGIDTYGSYATLYCCIFYNNSRYGVNALSNVTCINCVFDANGSAGFYCNNGTIERALLIGCRITNHSGAGDYGVLNNAASANRVSLVGCYFGNNSTDIDGTYDSVLVDGTSLLTLGGDDTNHGYTTPGSDWNLTSEATYRAQAIELD